LRRLLAREACRPLVHPAGDPNCRVTVGWLRSSEPGCWWRATRRGLGDRAPRRRRRARAADVDLSNQPPGRSELTRQARADLAHIDATLLLFDPDMTPDTIRAKAPVKGRSGYFANGNQQAVPRGNQARGRRACGGRVHRQAGYYRQGTRPERCKVVPGHDSALLVGAAPNAGSRSGYTHRSRFGS
jgi:hypothetical protein